LPIRKAVSPRRHGEHGGFEKNLLLGHGRLPVFAYECLNLDLIEQKRSSKNVLSVLRASVVNTLLDGELFSLTRVTGVLDGNYVN
jgi:hypothetical protein